MLGREVLLCKALKLVEVPNVQASLFEFLELQTVDVVDVEALFKVSKENGDLLIKQLELVLHFSNLIDLLYVFKLEQLKEEYLELLQMFVGDKSIGSDLREVGGSVLKHVFYLV